MADEVQEVQKTSSSSLASSLTSKTSAAPPTSGAASSRAAGETNASESAGSTAAASTTRTAGELDPGKSTVKGSTDYFDGKSVITDADTVIDIATIMKDNKFSNVPPDRLAKLLREKGYEVECVKIGNRGAIKFKNGDLYVDSDGDGNLGTKDQNFQSALSAVENKFGVNLSELKSSKYLQIYGGGKGGGKDGAAGVTGLDALNATDPMGLQKNQLSQVFSELDRRMAASGYNGNEGAEDLWQGYRLSPVLKELGIAEPSLPDPAAVGMPGGVRSGLDLFGAAHAIAQNREALEV